MDGMSQKKKYIWGRGGQVLGAPPTCVVKPTKNALRPECNLPSPDSQQAGHAQPCQTRRWCDLGDKGRKAENDAVKPCQ